MVIQVEIYFVTSATLNGIWCIVTVSDLQQQIFPVFAESRKKKSAKMYMIGFRKKYLTV